MDCLSVRKNGFYNNYPGTLTVQRSLTHLSLHYDDVDHDDDELPE